MTFKEISDIIKDKYSNAKANSDEEWIHVDNKDWLDLALFIKDSSKLSFDFLSCLSSVDREEAGIYVAYNFVSINLKHKLEIRVFVNENMEIESVSNIWKTANWHEREAYDMMGIKFDNHPNFKRILLPEDWPGYPLRKDFVTPDYYKGMPVPKDKTYWE